MSRRKKAIHALNSLKGWKIIFPIFIGLLVVGWFLYNEFDLETFSKLSLGWNSLFWIFMAFLMMLIRDLGYLFRIRVLSSGDLNWRQCFNVVFLWEFTSAITPTMVGGTAAAVVFVNKEGINVGRSSAIVMLTSFLDELYLIIMFPVLLILVKAKALFTIAKTNGIDESFSFSTEFFYFAVIGFGIILLYTSLLSYGLFFNPPGLKKLLLWIFKIRFLRKWRDKAGEAGDDIIRTSKEFRMKKISFWLKAFGSTFLSWTARYWVVNCLILAIVDVSDHFLIYARQLVMWIMMIVSPTPGGSGLAEFIFSKYLGEFLPLGLAVAMALLWRMVSYYPYLFIGTIMFPRWFRSKFIKKIVTRKTE
ncbi:YbhN family protein [Bacteroidota bacterium]